MDVSVLADQQNLIYMSSVQTLDVVCKTYRKRIERESGKYVLAVRLNDDVQKL